VNHTFALVPFGIGAAAELQTHRAAVLAVVKLEPGLGALLKLAGASLAEDLLTGIARDIGFANISASVTRLAELYGLSVDQLLGVFDAVNVICVRGGSHWTVRTTAALGSLGI
jgi:hypothetical protein